MSASLKCPQCGASEANLLQDNIYQCKFCGSIYESGDVKPVFQTTPKSDKPFPFDEKKLQEIPAKVMRFVTIAFAMIVIGFAASIFFSVKNKMKPSGTSTEPAKLYQDNNETNNGFTVVNSKNGPEVWTVSRRNSEGLKEVSYFLNRIDVKANKVVSSQPIGNTITWEQSFKEGYRIGQLKPVGTVCWLIYGDKILGFDINTQEEVMNNAVLSRQFLELKNGIAKAEEVYDMDGFKLTTKDGYIYYYAAAANVLLSEDEYADKTTAGNKVIDKTEYSFTDEERQQLYKINRKAGSIFYNKLSANTVSRMVEKDGDWYRRTYQVNAVEEFTPNEIYFKASVLYSDEKKIVLIYQEELGENAAIIFKCMDAAKKELWSVAASETEMLKPFLKSTNAESFLQGNQLVIIQPYQIAVCLNMDNGEINWSFKPY